MVLTASGSPKPPSSSRKNKGCRSYCGRVTPRLRRALVFSSLALLLSLALAAGLSHLALGPLERISRTLDSVSAGETDVVAEDQAQAPVE